MPEQMHNCLILENLIKDYKNLSGRYCHKSKNESCIKLAYRIWATEVNFNKSCVKSLSFFNKDIK